MGKLMSVPFGRPGARSKRRPGNQCVFVADDDPDMRALVVRVLAQQGYSSIAFDSGHELLTHLGTRLLDPRRFRAPDLIVVDLFMPGFSGLDVLVGLHRRSEDVPVIVITALRERGLRDVVLRSGASAFVQKPFHVPDLLETVHSVLDRRARTLLAAAPSLPHLGAVPPRP
jgi:DNA-binding response OmpR family regulator